MILNSTLLQIIWTFIQTIWTYTKTLNTLLQIDYLVLI